MSSVVLSLLNGEQLRENYARGFWRNETVYGVAAAHAGKSPERFAVRDAHRRLTWRHLVEAADAFAADLVGRGVRPGQRVTFWLPDRIESIVVLLACSRNGYVGCPSPHRNHTIADVQAMAERLAVGAFVYEPGFGADARSPGRERAIEQAVRGLPSVRHVYALAPLAAIDAKRAPFAGHLAGSPTADPTAGGQPVTDPDRVSYIAFTSGSTGQPKGVMHSDNTLLVTARALCRDWQIGPDSVVSTLSPFSHNLGVGALMTALVAGAELVLHDTPRGQSLVDRLAETGVDYLVGVPTHAIDLVAEVRRRGLKRLANVRAFRVSGAASPPHIMQDLVSVGVEQQSGYGMTENNSHQYTRPGDPLELIAGSCGRACEVYEVAIFDPEDHERRLPPGEVGLVAGRGASLMLGYFDDQKATESAFNASGWFMTGDLGRLDDHGYLRLTGRAKEVLIRGGHNINPARIEELAAGFPAIARAAVLALPDARLGECICLALTARAGQTVEPAALLAHLSGLGLSRYELPEFLLPMAELPLMANGKIDKPMLLRRVTAGELKPVAI